MKIFHAADLHYSPKHLKWVDQAFTHAVDDAIASQCDLAVIAGDSFDASMGIHEPAVTAYARQVGRLADVMQTVILQGTLSHDRPGSLDILRELRCRFPVRVIDKPERVCLTSGTPQKKKLIICALPSLNRADPEVMEHGPAEWVRRILSRWGAQRDPEVPTILVTHGTLTGCTTESGYAMISPDHEFTADALLAAECDAVMLGHIHQHQTWRDVTPGGRTCAIAYPGSIAKLVYGQAKPTGYIIWTIGAHGAANEFREAPSRKMIEIAFDGPPDMDRLKISAQEISPDDYIRIRWDIDQEHAASIDKTRIRELFANAGGCKLEGTVNPIESVRAGLINRAESLQEKIVVWAQTTGDGDSARGLCERLDMLKSMETEQIINHMRTQAKS